VPAEAAESVPETTVAAAEATEGPVAEGSTPEWAAPAAEGSAGTGSTAEGTAPQPGRRGPDERDAGNEDGWRR
jgi:hypothetical protein